MMQRVPSSSAIFLMPLEQGSSLRHTLSNDHFEGSPSDLANSSLGSTHQRLEIEGTFYGINPITYEVETVTLYKNGVLRKYGQEIEERILKPGQSPQTEIVRIWHLRDLMSLDASTGTDIRFRSALSSLASRAAKMKDEADQILGG